MTTGNDLLFRSSGGEFRNTESVYRHQGQERAKCNFAVTERQVILLGATTVVNMGAEEARLAEGQRLGVIVPAQEFLGLRMAEVVPIPDDFGGKGGEDLRKFLLV